MWKVEGSAPAYLIRQKTDFSWVKSLTPEFGRDRERGEHRPPGPSWAGRNPARKSPGFWFLTE